MALKFITCKTKLNKIKLENLAIDDEYMLVKDSKKIKT